MDVLDTKTPDELLRSILAESAKAQNELRCAQTDLRKAQSRQQFVLALVNQMLDRLEGDQDETQ